MARLVCYLLAFWDNRQAVSRSFEDWDFLRSREQRTQYSWVARWLRLVAENRLYPESDDVKSFEGQRKDRIPTWGWVEMSFRFKEILGALDVEFKTKNRPTWLGLRLFSMFWHKRKPTPGVLDFGIFWRAENRKHHIRTTRPIFCWVKRESR